MTAKGGHQSTVYTGDFHAVFFITRYRINPYLYSGFLLARRSPRDIEQRSGFTWQATSARLAGDVIQVWINRSLSNHCISHFKAQLAQWFLIQHLICTYWIKGILCGYAKWSGRHPEVGPAAADFPKDVCPTTWRKHKVFLLYITWYRRRLLFVFNDRYMYCERANVFNWLDNWFLVQIFKPRTEWTPCTFRTVVLGRNVTARMDVKCTEWTNGSQTWL